MSWKIRKIDHGLYSTTLFLHIVLSVTAGLSSYFWGLLSSSENLVLAAKTYTRARLNEEFFTRRGGAPVFPITVVGIHDHNVANRDLINRRLLADIIRDVARFEPAVIGVDYILDKPGPNPGDDQYLLQTLRREKTRLVVARALSETSRGFVPARTRFQEKVLKTGVAPGIVNVHHAPGEQPPIVRVTRAYFPGPIEEPNRVYPSFSFCVYLKYIRAKRGCSESRADMAGAAADGYRLLNFRRIHPALLFNILPLDQLRALAPLANARYETPLPEAPRNATALLRARVLRISEGEYFFHPRLRNTDHLRSEIASLKAAGPDTARVLPRYWNETYPPQLKDKIVIIGSQYSGKDLHHTIPHEFTSRREHGVMLHARAADNLIRGTLLRAAPPWLNAMIVVISILLTAWYTWSRGTRTVLVFFAGHMGLYILLNWILFLTAGIHYGTTWVVLTAVITLGLVGRMRALHTEWSATVPDSFTNSLPPRADEEAARALRRELADPGESTRPLLYVRQSRRGWGERADHPIHTMRPLIRELLSGNACLITHGPDDSMLLAWQARARMTDIVHRARSIAAAMPHAILVLDWAAVRIHMDQEVAPMLLGRSISRLMNAAGKFASRGPFSAEGGRILLTPAAKYGLDKEFIFRRRYSPRLFELLGPKTKKV